MHRLSVKTLFESSTESLYSTADSEFTDSNSESDTEQNTSVIMSESEKKRLIAAKGQCKGSITRLEKYLETAKSYTIEDLQVRRTNLQDIFEKYQDIALQLQLTDTEVEDDNTEDRILNLLAMIDRKVKTFGSQGIQGCSEMSQAKLPSLDIPVFDGRDFAAYKPFIEMFEAVVDQDKRIPNIQKLCFLKKYLKGEPLHIIDNLPIIGDSYHSAINMLKKRYDNPALIINSHVNALLDMPSLHRGTAQQLRDLVARARQQITALQNLQQPVSSWDAILSCIMLRKLDTFTARLYHSERDNTTAHTVDELLGFLEKRAAVLEASPTSGDNVNTNKSKFATHVATTANTYDKCILCPQQQHKVYKCPKFILMSPKGRSDCVIKNNLCKICLGSHPKKCRYNFKCSLCNSRNHNTLIHSAEGQPEPIQANEVAKSQAVNLHTHHSNMSTNVLLPTAKVMVSDAHNNKYVVKALLDCGSQTSFCTTALANKLQLPQFNSVKHISTLGNDCSTTSKSINITVHSMVQDYKFNATCSIIDKITTTLPQQHVNLKNFRLPKSIALADDEFHIPGEVSLLLAADVFFRIVQDGKVEGSPEDPVLLNTRLGYVVSGSISVSHSYHSKNIVMHTAVSSDLDQCVRQFWEAEKVPEVYLETISEHEHSEKVFEQSVSLKDNRFEVKFPLKVNMQDIDPSNSFIIALQRLYNLEKRFIKDPEFHNLYKQFIQEYLNLGHAKIIEIDNCTPNEQPIFFLPHHAVLRPDKATNKLRTVFDGSAKLKNGQCLNDALCNGPVVQNSLFDILLLFRTYKYTIQCDIRHMYRMIFMHPEHRPLQNILWRENGVLQCLQLQTITYGLKSSAFLATRCLIELARRFKSEFPLASEAILKNSYVDDIQGGSETLQGAIQLKKRIKFNHVPRGLQTS